MKRIQVYDGEGDCTLDVLVTAADADALVAFLEALDVGDVYADDPPSARLAEALRSRPATDWPGKTWELDATPVSDDTEGAG